MDEMMGHSAQAVQYQGTPSIGIRPHQTTPDRVELVRPRNNRTVAAVRARYAGPVQLVSDGDAFTV
jgi:hypothetical protein